VSLLYSLTTEAELIQVTSMAIKQTNKSFLFLLGGLFPYLSLVLEGWLWIGWVVSFGGFEYLLDFVVVGARNKLGSTLLTLVLTSLKANTQFICGLGYTLFHMVQVILNQFLTHHSSLKMRSQIGNHLF
jgi:nitrate reductase NapE component